jgi:hypothetical protein
MEKSIIKTSKTSQTISKPKTPLWTKSEQNAP